MDIRLLSFVVCCRVGVGVVPAAAAAPISCFAILFVIYS